MSFRQDIKAYADAYWWIPCKDGLVYTRDDRINCAAVIARQKKSSSEWKAAFLLYGSVTPGTGWRREGLFLINASSIPSVIPRKFDAPSFPEAIMISSWSDNAGTEHFSERPPYNGLNDCAHFVTESLAAGGINVKTTMVPVLLGQLQALSDTKTLALAVAKDRAKAIIKSGIMDVGDVIIFSLTPSDHHHSTIYLGGEKIAMHTRANHANHPVWNGDWTRSSSHDHPLVTLIHFGRDDTYGATASWIPGWWQVSWRGEDYYYFFDGKGHVGYTQSKPQGSSQPLSSPRQRGYWFDRGSKVQVCWTKTGSLEDYTVGPDPSMLRGTWNGTEPVLGAKMAF